MFMLINIMISFFCFHVQVPKFLKEKNVWKLGISKPVLSRYPPVQDFLYLQAYHYMFNQSSGMSNRCLKDCFQSLKWDQSLPNIHIQAKFQNLQAYHYI